MKKNNLEPRIINARPANEPGDTQFVKNTMDAIKSHSSHETFSNVLRKTNVTKEKGNFFMKFKNNLIRGKLLKGGLATAAFAVLLIVGLTFIQSPSTKNGLPDITKNITPQPVSAAELLDKTAGEYKKQKQSAKDYALTYSTIKTKKGPRFETCNRSGYMGSTAQVSEGISYSYNSTKTNVEAKYIKITDDGKIASEYSYYDDTAAESDPAAEPASSLDDFFKEFEVNGELAYLFVNENGQPRDKEPITPVLEAKRYVYKVNLTPNDRLITADCNEIIQITIDAENFYATQYNVFKDSVKSGNLIVENTEQREFSNPNDTEALNKMKQAGFDKKTACRANDPRVPECL